MRSEKCDRKAKRLEKWNHKIYHKACKALAAFYVLRRATSVNTDRIDDIFRSSLVGTSSYNGLKIDCSNPNALTYEDLEEFKNHLKSQLSTKELEFRIK